MPSINLIYEQRVALRQRERRTRAFFLTFLGVSIFSAATLGGLYLQTEDLRGEAAAASRKLTKLQPVMNAIEEREGEMKSMGPRLATLEDAQKATQRWSRILDFLTRNMPEGTWLTNIRSQQSNPSEPVTATMIGLSSSQDAVANLLLRLRRNADFDTVELKYTQEDTSAGRVGALKFEIVATVAGTAAKPPAKKDGDAEKKS